MKRINTPKETLVSFYWNDQLLTGHEGESLASALMANGLRVVGRSFKYGRKRGLIAFGSEESNALVTLEPNSNYQIPNMKASEVYLYNGLRAVSATATPSLSFDWRVLFKPFSRFMPVGFYYKTFKWPASFWLKYEKPIRQLAGFSRVDPSLVDPDKYVTKYDYCDVAVVGGGISGLQAACDLAQAGQRVMLMEQTRALGGESLAACASDETLQTKLKQLIQQVESSDQIELLYHTTAFSFQDQLLQAVETKQDHLSITERSHDRARQVLHQIRAKKLVLATGAHERPLLFKNNDHPGIMLASAARRYLNQSGVLFATNPVIVTNNDSAYALAEDLVKIGTRPTIVDLRSEKEVGAEAQAVISESSVKHYCGYVPIQSVASGSGKQYGVSELTIAPVDWVANHWSVGHEFKKIRCNGVAVSGGFSPVIHLCVHDGSRATYCEKTYSFLPPQTLAETNKAACGSINGAYLWQECVDDAKRAASQVLAALSGQTGEACDETVTKLSVAPPFTPLKQPLAFVDFQNDVKVSDIDLAIRENYQSIEHIKRYTATGFGTDQGKTSNINAIAVAANILSKPMNEVSTTTFRPPYNAVTFGALSGGHQQVLFDAARYTSMHSAHEALGAVWEQVGQWYRPRYYPKGQETMHQAVERECLAARENVAMMDVSTLGKIDIKGKDARKFLSRVYTNAWGKLGVNQARYGLMCDERGMIYDDGVSVCLADDHFYMTTTSGGAARVYETLELWLQTEWTDLEIYASSITDQWSAVAVVGPNARALMTSVATDIDFDNEAFPFMHMREGKWNGLDVKIARISFSGELSYEITVASSDGAALWDKVAQAGKAFDITPYGTETMHVLRAEKGYIIVGQDTDGSNTPDDMNMSWAVRPNTEMSFIGERSLKRSDMLKETRKQLIGFRNEDKSNNVLPEGASLVLDDALVGHITSSYYSPSLGYAFGLAMLESGRARIGQTVMASAVNGTKQKVVITDPVFYDPEGGKLRS